MHKGKVRSARMRTMLASSQISACIGLESPPAIWLRDGSPLRVGLIWMVQMHEGGVRVNSPIPAVVASGKIVSVAASNCYFVADSDEFPVEVRPAS